MSSVTLLQKFWAAKIKAGTPIKEQELPEGTLLQITQAALTGSTDGRTSLFVVANEEKYLICTLIPNVCDQFSLGLMFAEDEIGEVQFLVEGPGEVHVTGSIVDEEMDQPPFGFDGMSDEGSEITEEEEEEEEEEEIQPPKKAVVAKAPAKAAAPAPAKVVPAKSTAAPAKAAAAPAKGKPVVAKEAPKKVVVAEPSSDEEEGEEESEEEDKPKPATNDKKRPKPEAGKQKEAPTKKAKTDQKPEAAAGQLQCDVCKKSFKNAAGLQQHKADKHK